MEPPEGIAEARRFLERAEGETNPQRKIEELKQGVDLLDLYVEERPDAPEDTLTYITNLRRSHTRRLLVQLLSLKQIEIETWILYIVLLVTKLRDEVDYVTSQDPTLKTNYAEFCRAWDDVLREALKKYAK
ncbi:MAG: hypothetical protein ACOY42_13620 [Pseudomonadota bacterium]